MHCGYVTHYRATFYYSCLWTMRGFVLADENQLYSGVASLVSGSLGG